MARVAVKGIAKPLKEGSLWIYRDVQDFIRTLWMRISVIGVKTEVNRSVRFRMNAEPRARGLPSPRQLSGCQVRWWEADGAGAWATRHSPGRLAQPLLLLLDGGNRWGVFLPETRGSKEKRAFGRSRLTGCQH
jgi:hypothetical protein